MNCELKSWHCANIATRPDTKGDTVVWLKDKMPPRASLEQFTTRSIYGPSLPKTFTPPYQKPQRIPPFSLLSFWRLPTCPCAAPVPWDSPLGSIVLVELITMLLLHNNATFASLSHQLNLLFPRQLVCSILLSLYIAEVGAATPAMDV